MMANVMTVPCILGHCWLIRNDLFWHAHHHSLTDALFLFLDIHRGPRQHVTFYNHGHRNSILNKSGFVFNFTDFLITLKAINGRKDE